MPLTISATGHRPDKLGGYNTVTLKRVQLTASFAIKFALGQFGPDITIISGMALGWDLAIANAAVTHNVKLICAIPFSNQPSRWPAKEVEEWARVKSHAAEFHIISPNPTNKQEAAEFLQLRNEWMIDRGEFIFALHNGGRGGTANAVKYAKQQRKQIINFWESFQKETL